MPGSICASITLPFAGTFGLAFSSMISACNKIISSNVSMTLLRGRRNVDGDGVATPRFRAQTVFLQLFLDAVRVRRRQVALVNGDDNRDLRRFGVADGFDASGA